jgi:sugar/nucleoside kinase (ribokinase family)
LAATAVASEPIPAAKRVLVVGDVMTDIICTPEGPIEIGSDRRATIRSRPGGSGANPAVWLAAFGLKVSLAARIGAADLEIFTRQFLALGVDPAFTADSERPSGTLVTILSPDGERSFLTDRAANASLSATDLPPRLLDGCDTLVVSGYSLFEPEARAGAVKLIAAARARRLPVAVDPASVGFLKELGADAFLAATAGATTIFANEPEALMLTGAMDAESAIRHLSAHYPRVIIKLGPAGAMLGTRHGIELTRTAPNVSVIDTTGAGDAFAAAFIAAELRGATADVALERAIAAGSDVVTRIGGQPPAR